MNTSMIGKSLMKRHYLKRTFLPTPKQGDITGSSCTHAKKVCIDFEINDLSKYRDLYV